MQRSHTAPLLVFWKVLFQRWLRASWLLMGNVSIQITKVTSGQWRDWVQRTPGCHVVVGGTRGERGLKGVQAVVWATLGNTEDAVGF